MNLALYPCAAISAAPIDINQVRTRVNWLQRGASFKYVVPRDIELNFLFYLLGVAVGANDFLFCLSLEICVLREPNHPFHRSITLQRTSQRVRKEESQL